MSVGLLLFCLHLKTSPRAADRSTHDKTQDLREVLWYMSLLYLPCSRPSLLCYHCSEAAIVSPRTHTSSSRSNQNLHDSSRSSDTLHLHLLSAIDYYRPQKRIWVRMRSTLFL